MNLIFTKRKTKNWTSGRHYNKKDPNNKNIRIYLPGVWMCSRHPIYKNKDLDEADNVKNQLIQTILCEVICFSASHVGFRCNGKTCKPNKIASKIMKEI